MLEVGAHAATDITGFGLAGHAFAMAEGSGVTLIFQLSRLPLFPGAEKLAHRPYLSRASATNASYVAPGLRLEGTPDPIRLEFFYDAQTSGGLLISVAAGRAEDLVARLHARGIAEACIVGEVMDRTDNTVLIVRP
jgi:selenide,water dikinase